MIAPFDPLDSLGALCADDPVHRAIVAAAAHAVAEIAVTGRYSTARAWIIDAEGGSRTSTSFERLARHTRGARMRAWGKRHLRPRETLVSVAPATRIDAAGERDAMTVRAQSFGGVRAWGADITNGQLGTFYTLTRSVPHVAWVVPQMA